MTFLELQKRVAELSGLDQSDGGTQTRIQAWINLAYQELSAFFDWPWLLKQGTIQTIEDITTGTVSVINGSTTITFSVAPSISVQDQWAVSVSSSSGGGTEGNDIYFITSHTAGSTTAILDKPYLQVTNPTATYILRRLYYSLPSDLDRLQDIHTTVNSTKLDEIDPLTLDRILPYFSTSNQTTPQRYYFMGLDTSNNWQIGLDPYGSIAVNLLIRYYKKITELVNSNDEPIVPTKYHQVIAHLALSLYAYQFVDDTRIQQSDARAKEFLAEMVRNARPGKDYFRVIQPWDMRIRSRPLRPRLPGNFGYIS